MIVDAGTLIICPASLLQQWEEEVKNRCKRRRLSVLVFHGNNRSIEVEELSKFNLVITTYQTLVRESNAESEMYNVSNKNPVLFLREKEKLSKMRHLYF